jgi:phenylalanyl-tRNA synthetase beta chain
MKFIYQDLLNFLVEKPSKELLSKKLFQLGHEHEIDGDIFDLELTPNRGDCLSLNGLARDLNIFFGKIEPFKIFEGDIESLNLNFKNLSPNACPKVSFLEIEIEDRLNTYKPYLENYFFLPGINRTNFFTDISNYISYELGQPTHCFEADSISGQLIFENRACDESFKSLLGSDIKLTGNNCIFSVDNKIISLAGVMGGDATACSAKTKKVLVECAFFMPESIIGKSVQYNLTSDAAHKFERGVDIQAQEKVLRRFIEIVRDHASIKNIKIQSFEDNKVQQESIPIDIKKINKILGTEIEEKEYLIFIDKLGLNINQEIIVPSHRHDISSQNDLAEEVARIIGYNNIESKPIKISKKTDKIFDNIQNLKNYLIDNGFSEIINSPFTKNKEKHSISIDNPLDSNRNHFRTSLKESLIDNLLYNERRQQDSIKLFEISDIYYLEKEKIKSQKKLGIICSGRVGKNYKDFSKNIDVTYLKNILGKFIKEITFDIKQIPRDNLDSKIKNPIAYVEFEINDLLKYDFKKNKVQKKLTKFKKYNPISEYPLSQRDLSFSIKKKSSYPELQKLVLNYDDEIIKEIFIFDFFYNEKNHEIKIGFRIVFQSLTKTITDDEVNDVLDCIIDDALRMDSVNIPGLVR